MSRAFGCLRDVCVLCVCVLCVRKQCPAQAVRCVRLYGAGHRREREKEGSRVSS